ncbi:MAG TPA: hypothetical protein VGQ11_05850, partial [Candidatus Acidoferrales bacterium]|nr:hypothetical protein [Candidatus Acidoferrales bacterium]
ALRAVWLTPYALGVSLLAFAAGVWFGWISDTVSGDIRIIFRCLTPAEIIFLLFICLYHT